MAFRGQGVFVCTDDAKPEPFVIFPEITLPGPKLITEDSDLEKYENFWRNSSYHLGNGVLKRDNESLDIERFSDALKPKSKSNYDYLLLRPDNFPRDLLEDTRREWPVKRAKWSVDAALRKIDVFEKLEAKVQVEGKDKKGREDEDDELEEDEEEVERKDEKGGEEEDDEPEENEDKGKEEIGEEEEEEDDDDEEPEEDEDEESDNGDYEQNQDFDDDHDDYNPADDGDDYNQADDGDDYNQADDIDWF